MQATHQDDVVRACQQRDPHACEQLVRSQQETALRTAYLLTGDTAAAVRLASDAFLVLVPELFHAEPDRDVRSWLLQIIAGRYLAGQSAMSGAGSAPAADAGTQRFAVDDERSRTLAALGRLDRQTRTLLVLHDFGRLDEANLAALLGLSRYDFAARAPRLRQAGRGEFGRPPRSIPVRFRPGCTVHSSRANTRACSESTEGFAPTSLTKQASLWQVSRYFQTRTNVMQTP